MENAIIANIIKFLQELSVGFSLYGKQYHIRVSDKDYYVDLLFYHTRLHCFVAAELKVTEFMPEYAGKLEFYINPIDEQLKMAEDNPTIGLLLYKIADKIIVEYSLKTKTKPMGVAEYKHAIPKKRKNELPDENLLKQELEKEIIIPQKLLNEKIERLRETISKLNENTADLEKDNDIVRKIHNEIQQPLIKLIDKKLTEKRRQVFALPTIAAAIHYSAGTTFLSGVFLQPLLSMPVIIYIQQNTISLLTTRTMCSCK